MENKKKLQYRETHEKILETFLEILKKKKDLNRITAAEVCRKAGITRSTFYTHYQDIYDVIDKTGREYAEKLAILITSNLPTTARERTLNTLNFIKDHRSFYDCYLKSGRRIQIPDELVSREDKVRKNLITREICGDNSMTAKCLWALTREAFNVVVKNWIEGDCRESPEMIFNILHKIKNVLTTVGNPDAAEDREGSAGKRNA